MTLPLYDLWCAVVYGDGNNDASPSPSRRGHTRGAAVDRVEEDPAAERIRAGDASEFEAQVVAHFAGLVRFVVGLVGDRDAAEDVVQDIFSRVWERRDTFHPGPSIRAYFYGAVRNRAFNTLAHEAVRQKTASLLLADVEPGEENDSHADATMLTALRNALATLTERRRTAVRLRYEEGLSYPEIATAMAISTGSAEQLVFHAVRALRVALGVV